MSALMCRSCLSDNIEINHIKNTHLQDIYEKLTDTKLVTENGWPETVCYSCYEQLQKCHKFSILSQYSQNILTQFYIDGTELTPANVAAHTGKANPETSSSIKYEAVEEVLQEVTIKEEEIESDTDGLIEDIKVEGTDELNVEDTKVFSSNKYSVVNCNATSSENIIIKTQNIGENKEKSLDKQSFNCDFCNKTYSLKRSLQKHVASKHFDAKSDYETVETSNILTYTGTTYTCMTCNKSFVKSMCYHRHLKSHIKKQFDCKKCDSTFVDKKILEAHKKSHAPEKSRACDRCGKRFINDYLLKRHMRTHTGKKSYECDICGKKFADRDSIRLHLRIHTGQKPYSCKECNVSFVQIGNLRRHNMIHHMIGEKRFYCESCQRPFYDNSLYKRHMRIHTGERPFVCEDCGKAYSDKDNYKRHRRLHTGEQPYACKLCDYKSSWANCLKYHLAKAHSKK